MIHCQSLWALSSRLGPDLEHGPALTHRDSRKHGMTRLVCLLLMAQLVGAAKLMLLLGAAVLEMHFLVDRRLAQHQKPRVSKICTVEPSLHANRKALNHQLEQSSRKDHKRSFLFRVPAIGPDDALNNVTTMTAGAVLKMILCTHVTGQS